MGLKQLIINDETGEILGEEVISLNYNVTEKKKRICKRLVDEMLERASKGEELDKDLLFAWCKITNNINIYGQVKLLGSYTDNATNKKLLEDVMLTGYTMRLVDVAHSFSCILMKNREVAIKNWTELYEMIDMPSTNKRHQQKLKKFLENNNIVRTMKVKDMNGNNITKFILNPFLFRKASHSSQIALVLFQDYIKEGVNIGCYPLRWLQSMGYIDK